MFLNFVKQLIRDRYQYNYVTYQILLSNFFGELRSGVVPPIEVGKGVDAYQISRVECIFSNHSYSQFKHLTINNF